MFSSTRVNVITPDIDRAVPFYRNLMGIGLMGVGLMGVGLMGVGLMGVGQACSFPREGRPRHGN